LHVEDGITPFALAAIERACGIQHFGVVWTRFGSGGNFLARGVIERPGRRHIRGVSRVAPPSSVLAEWSALPGAHGNRVKQSGASDGAIHELLQSHA